MMRQTTKQLLQIALVRGNVRREQQNIVYVSENTRHSLQDVINEPLKRLA